MMLDAAEFGVGLDIAIRAVATANSIDANFPPADLYNTGSARAELQANALATHILKRRVGHECSFSKPSSVPHDRFPMTGCASSESIGPANLADRQANARGGARLLGAFALWAPDPHDRLHAQRNCGGQIGRRDRRPHSQANRLARPPMRAELRAVSVNRQPSSSAGTRASPVARGRIFGFARSSEALIIAP